VFFQNEIIEVRIGHTHPNSTHHLMVNILCKISKPITAEKLVLENYYFFVLI